jgi:hypothetical protein
MDAETVTSAHAVATDVVPPALPAESARPATLPPSQHLPPVQPPTPRTAVASAAAAEPSIRIGTVEVRVTPPALSPPPRRSAPAAMPARGTLSRGFTSSFGLKEG